MAYCIKIQSFTFQMNEKAWREKSCLLHMPVLSQKPEPPDKVSYQDKFLQITKNSTIHVESWETCNVIVTRGDAKKYLPRPVGK